MRMLCLLLAILCLLPSCAPKEPTPDTVAERMEAYGTAALRRADEDFVRTNFGAADRWETADVYLSAAGDGTEIGIFWLTDVAHTEEMKATVREYMESERRSVESLAALYPGEELDRRLARFEHAVIESQGRMVYYILADEDQQRELLSALKSR